MSSTGSNVITLRSSNGPGGGEGHAVFTRNGTLLSSDIDTEYVPVQLDLEEWKKTYPDENPEDVSHDILDWGYWFCAGMGADGKPVFAYTPPEKEWRDEFLFTTWILDPDDPKAVGLHRYDKLEISPVLDTEGHAEILHEAPPDGRRAEVYWSLYGHIPGQGVECIGDFKSRGHAYQVAKRLGYRK